MRTFVLLLSSCLVSVLISAAGATAQVVRVEAESGALNGFSIVEGGGWSGGARINGDIAAPTATYVFTGWDGVYDVSVRYCDEDDGNSSYALSGSAAGAIASWQGDQPTGSTLCDAPARLIRTVATSVALEQGETVTFECQRDPGEPCRVDYFDFAYIPPQPPPSSQPAFPGAMGFGAGATGARGFGAQVCVVTNLDNGGPGSFRSCAEQGPPAYVTFAVSGYIDLADEVDIVSNKTIECATALGDGVVFRGWRLNVTGSNVVLRGCRAWPGGEPGGQPPDVRDGIVVGNDVTNEVARDVIVANNSIMFAIDENAGTWRPVENVTFQHNIVAWALRDAGHEDEFHSMALLIGEFAESISIVENFLAFNDFRNPRVARVAEPVEIVNNLMYCHWHDAVDLDHHVERAHVIGNRFRARFRGPDGGCDTSYDDPRLIELGDGSVAFALDNTRGNGVPASIYVDGTSEIVEEPLFATTLVPAASSEVEQKIFASAGPARLIAFEIDVFDHYLNGTGAIIDSVDDLGGWPTLQGGTNPPDSDGDGMPDWWEAMHCSNQWCAPTGDHDGDGYENIEEWFHVLYCSGFNCTPAGCYPVGC